MVMVAHMYEYALKSWTVHLLNEWDENHSSVKLFVCLFKCCFCCCAAHWLGEGNHGSWEASDEVITVAQWDSRKTLTRVVAMEIEKDNSYQIYFGYTPAKFGEKLAVNGEKVEIKADSHICDLSKWIIWNVVYHQESFWKWRWVETGWGQIFWKEILISVL